MVALVDCNNFYCSCERVFNPSLNGRPMVVLSNNDGCVIARSEEAKTIGIVMGTPEYMVRELIKKNNVAVFSSNYTLYGDMSDRVMKLLANFAPSIELYSIDEAFLDMRELRYTDLLQLGVTIRKTVYQCTGIPITVGIAPTKTLAKMANRYAKKQRKESGVHWLAHTDLIRQALAFTEVSDIWGVGKQYAGVLQRNGFKTALDLAAAPEEWIRITMSVVGLRLLKELNGIPCMEWEYEPQRKKNICTSRSFGTKSQDKTLLAEAISNHAAACARKLRTDKSCAKKLNVFIHTNPFRTQDRQHSQSVDIEMNVPTSDSAEIIKYALMGLDIIFRKDHNYIKCGVIVSDLVPEAAVQKSIFDEINRQRSKTVMDTMDRVNRSLGTEIVRFAAQGFEKRYRLKREYLSQRYTTNSNELLHVKI